MKSESCKFRKLHSIIEYTSIKVDLTTFKKFIVIGRFDNFLKVVKSVCQIFQKVVKSFKKLSNLKVVRFTIRPLVYFINQDGITQMSRMEK